MEKRKEIFTNKSNMFVGTLQKDNVVASHIAGVLGSN